MIRIRRIAARLPFARLYEVDLAPRGRPDLAKRYITRVPNALLEPVVGVGDASSFVHQADRDWKGGNRGWAVEFEEQPGG